LPRRKAAPRNDSRIVVSERDTEYSDIIGMN
jgi:hypothetical protein